MMKADRIELILMETGGLTLTGLPFQAGEAVEMIGLANSKRPIPVKPAQAFPLAGKALQYDDPFGSVVAPDNWEVLQ